MSELTRTFRVDPEFRDRIPAPNDDAFKGLEADILADGAILDPLKIWEEEGILLDGHHRYTIAQTHGLPFQTHMVSLPDRESALDWIDRHAINQRNLPADLESLIRGRIYNRTKKAAGRPSDKLRQSGGISETAPALAESLGVSPRTLERDGAFAAAVDKLGIAPEVTTGTITAPRSKVIDAAKNLPAKPTPKQKAKAKEALEAPASPKPASPVAKATDDRDARIAQLTRLLAERDQEVADLKERLTEVSDLLAEAAKDNVALAAENESMKNVINTESGGRLMGMMAENKRIMDEAATIKANAERDVRVYKSQNNGYMVGNNDLANRLKGALRKIEKLEKKLKTFAGQGAGSECEVEPPSGDDEDYNAVFGEAS